jgi:exodeoxyribonuclease VII small subunit
MASVSSESAVSTVVEAGETPSFEQALAELESLVEKMEDGSLSLEDSLSAYRRGAALVKVCETALEHAKEQVRVLDGDLLRPLSEVATR